MKKLLGLVLALVLVLSLAACGAGGADTALTDAKLKGTWEMTCDMSKALDASSEIANSLMGAELPAAVLDTLKDADLVFEMLLVFDGEGKMQVMLDKKTFNDLMSNMMNALLTEETMYAIYEAQGLSKEDVDTMFSSTGMSMSSVIAMTKLQLSSMDFIEMAFPDAGDGDYITSGSSQVYRIDGNKLTTDGMSLEFDGTNLILKEMEETDSTGVDISKMLPLTAKKVSDKTEY